MRKRSDINRNLFLLGFFCCFLFGCFLVFLIKKESKCYFNIFAMNLLQHFRFILNLLFADLTLNFSKLFLLKNSELLSVYSITVITDVVIMLQLLQQHCYKELEEQCTYEKVQIHTEQYFKRSSIPAFAEFHLLTVAYHQSTLSQ